MSPAPLPGNEADGSGKAPPPRPAAAPPNLRPPPAEAPASVHPLKSTLRSLIQQCPLGERPPGCPFGTLGLLTFGSRNALLAEMSAEQCLRLFDLMPGCRCPGDPRRRST